MGENSLFVAPVVAKLNFKALQMVNLQKYRKKGQEYICF
jgi:hypothetical protein